jgi:cell division protein DivIC
MQKVWHYLKNKWILSTALVVLYILILHDTDIFSLKSKMDESAETESSIEFKQREIEDLKIALEDLDDPRELERYAREEHFFKKSTEDLYIVSFK